MALTRKFLSALGIEEEKAEQIIAAHTESTDYLKSEINKYKDDAEKLPTVQEQLNQYIEAEKKSEKDPYKVKYEAVKEEFETYKNGIVAKETAVKKESAYKQLLKDAGVSDKRIPAILKVSNIDDIELDEEGKLKDADALSKAIKAEWSDFIATTSTEGASVATPPSNSTNAVKTKKEIMEIKDTAERQAAWKAYISNQKGS